MDDRTQALCRFLDSAHSLYHAQAGLVKALEEQGYRALSEGSRWEIAPGGRYYVTRGGSAVIAFRVPEG